MKLKIGIMLMIVSSFCVCLGQLFWKLSADYGAYLIIFGFALYGIGALFMILAYRFGPLSVLQPILCINYILSILLAAAVLGERITISKVFSVFFIIIGVLFIVAGEKN